MPIHVRRVDSSRGPTIFVTVTLTNDCLSVHFEQYCCIYNINYIFMYINNSNPKSMKLIFRVIDLSLSYNRCTQPHDNGNCLVILKHQLRCG